MLDRRSQRIREQLRQHPNPRNAQIAPLSFGEQIRKVYLSSSNQGQPIGDEHTQLARQLEVQRKRRR